MTTSSQTRPTASDSYDSASERRLARTRELFALAQDCADEAERRALMDTVIEMHLDYAHAQAARYRARGVPLDDLRQVAAMALTKATRGYDVSSGHDFMSYAGPTIRGELRKYFRDHGWMIRPTRRIQELQARIGSAETELTHDLGRSPRPTEIAERLGEAPESVLEALASDGCFTPASLDYPTGEDGTVTTLGDLLPGGFDGREAAEARMTLAPVLGSLPERDQLIIGMRFYEGLTQREIAQRIGVTQMQVSRLLTRILAQLRVRVGEVPTY
jgi:RNA polymerase sigma-B factor